MEDRLHRVEELLVTVSQDLAVTSQITKQNAETLRSVVKNAKNDTKELVSVVNEVKNIVQELKESRVECKKDIDIIFARIERIENLGLKITSSVFAILIAIIGFLLTHKGGI